MAIKPEDGQKVRNIWDIVKTIIEIIIAAIAGAATGATAKAAGLIDVFANL